MSNKQLNNHGWECNIEGMKIALSHIKSMVDRREPDVNKINETIDRVYYYIFEMIGYWGPYKEMSFDDFKNTEILTQMFR